MKILGTIFWIRIWTPVTMVTAFVLLKFPAARAFIQGYEPWVVVVTLAVLGVCFGLTAMVAFDSENTEDFLSDIKGDIFWFAVSSNTLTYLLASNGLTDHWLPITMFGIVCVITVGDMAVSLRGGAKKLYEVDKGRFSVDKRWIIVHNPKQSPAIRGALKYLRS
jgi:hypothetical protein